MSWVATTRAPEHHTLPLLNHLARVASRAAESALSPTGLRPRHLVALGILDVRGPSSQQGLIEALSLDPSNVVGLLNELETRDLIERRRDPADRRRHIVEISAAGRTELRAAQVRLARAEDHVLTALSTDERSVLHDLLVRVVGGQISVACAAADEPPPASCTEAP
jgi:DNA-binding MarR family transcriptional regulator